MLASVNNSLISLATPGGLEPPTFSLEGCCSIRLSYGVVLPVRGLYVASMPARQKRGVRVVHIRAPLLPPPQAIRSA
jgi:hypothetical protein